MRDYLLRYSKRAKHLQLRLSHRGLEVIVPARKKILRESIEQFICEKEHWIKRNWERFGHSQNGEKAPLVLPNEINLQAIEQVWQVKYFQTDQPRLRLHTNVSREITLLGDVANEHLCLKGLRDWIIQMASHYLQQQLQILSLETGLIYDRVSIRNTSTRWGSCSSEKNISLCCKLLFLPSLLVKHVLLHELCHTKVMHHGKKFWHFLE